MSVLKKLAENRFINDKPVRAVGLMTGTVLDGNIDVALLETDGHTIESFGRYMLAPYTAHTVELLHECMQSALNWQFDGPEPSIFAKTEKQLTIEQTSAVQRLLNDTGFTCDDIAVVGFHGQTVLHRPPVKNPGLSSLGQTRQLGDGRLMCQLLGIAVVNDFRSADMLAGGQGAPLSSVYHKALLRNIVATGDTAVLNLGGVANLTWWDGHDHLVAFDTGPANAPLNDFVRHMGEGEMDRDGALAARGKVDNARLQQLLDHPYFTQDYPKSLDRFDFSWHIANGLSAADGAALLTAFSAAAVAKALDLLPQRPSRLVVCGGGRHNPSLMFALQQRTGTEIIRAEALGWRGDALEAECFAYLAVRALMGLPISYPQTTGASESVCGGSIHMP